MIEKVSCNLCGAQDWRLLPRETTALLLPPPRALVRCNKCGLIFQNPRVISDVKLYDSRAYYDEFDYDRMVQKIRRAHFSARLDEIAARLGRIGRILDVGCATGEFLQLAHEQGWQGSGLDVSSYAIAEARRRYGLEAQRGTLTGVHYESESFDVVHMNHVLEHLPDPRAALEKAHYILRDSGILVLEVPYEFYNAADTWRRMFRREIIRTRPSLYHLYFFSARTLTQMLRETGFVPKLSACTDPSEQFTPRVYLKPLRWMWILLGDLLVRGSNIVAFAGKVKK